MFPPRTALRTIAACTLACGLLATTTGSAAARPIDDGRDGSPTSSLAGTTSETPRQDLRSPDTRDAARPVPQDLRSPDARDAASAEQIARSMEAYYESFDKPMPVAPFASRARVAGARRRDAVAARSRPSPRHSPSCWRAPRWCCGAGVPPPSDYAGPAPTVRTGVGAVRRGRRSRDMSDLRGPRSLAGEALALGEGDALLGVQRDDV